MTSEARPASEQILDEVRRRRAGERVVDVDEARVQLVVFTLGDALYAFNGADVKEILPPGRIYYVPGAPDGVLGVVNVRGDIESVVAINALLGLPHAPRTPRNRIVLVATAAMRSGILVDSIEDVVDVPVSSVIPSGSLLDETRRELVTGAVPYRSRHVTLLDVDKLFARIAP